MGKTHLKAQSAQKRPHGLEQALRSPQLEQFPHKKAFSQKPGKRLYRRHFFPKKRPCPQKFPQKHVYFQCFPGWCTL